MKINKKALELIDKGLSSKTVSKLTESQINVLYTKLVSEQSSGTVMVPKTDVNKINQLKQTKQTFQVYEKELEEDEEVSIDPNKDSETQNPHQVGPSSDDGFGTEDDGMGMFEEKKNEPNPWAICHAQVGPKKTRKFERCVMAVKKQLEEGKNPVSLFLETQIEKIVEKHIPPRITKGDLIKVLSESEPAVAPTKPVTKPDTKPTTKPNRPSHPGKNPNPGENPAPKAKKKEAKESSAPAPTTKPAPTKPTTKPDTRPRPSHPGKNPNPGENPSPKAKKISPEQAKDEVIDVIMKLIQK
jgi:hypothetical protein